MERASRRLLAEDGNDASSPLPHRPGHRRSDSALSSSSTLSDRPTRRASFRSSSSTSSLPQLPAPPEGGYTHTPGFRVSARYKSVPAYSMGQKVAFDGFRSELGGPTPGPGKYSEPGKQGRITKSAVSLRRLEHVPRGYSMGQRRDILPVSALTPGPGSYDLSRY